MTRNEHQARQILAAASEKLCEEIAEENRDYLRTNPTPHPAPPRVHLVGAQDALLKKQQQNHSPFSPNASAEDVAIENPVGSLLGFGQETKPEA